MTRLSLGNGVNCHVVIWKRWILLMDGIKRVRIFLGNNCHKTTRFHFLEADCTRRFQWTYIWHETSVCIRHKYCPLVITYWLCTDATRTYYRSRVDANTSIAWPEQQKPCRSSGRCLCASFVAVYTKRFYFRFVDIVKPDRLFNAISCFCALKQS